MVTKTPRNVTVQAIAVTVMAAALTVSCAAKSSNVAGQPIPATTTSASVSSANTAAANAKSGAPTAEQALARWIGAVVSGNFDQACSVMADAEQTPPKVFSPETCAGQDETMKSVHKVLDGLRTAFTPDNAANPPEVEIAGPAATGDSAKIAADRISVEGKTLDDIVLSHSTGVQPGQTNITFSLRKLEEAWYVTNFDLKI
ncbi:hypothetical protein [Amycolatopsis sp. WQ 127309]|uniref:hypothetical protein n=1 Tax=Amycolatopsis sp. WQ 127309 TaxID=2932773 RepID=UPI001FF621D4|nr:hypothetical protein [Amycolatopsis sp. WQ 127309]UOZ04935.1 hypothetical protein MUY22_39890 [Amycolatopsis sp. WQ 127309]